MDFVKLFVHVRAENDLSILPFWHSPVKSIEAVIQQADP